MSNFYVKIKNFENIVEFSTDDEKLFKEKVQQFLTEFSNFEVNIPPKNNIGEQSQENVNMAGFIDIQPSNDTVNQIQGEENKDITLEFEQILDKSKDEPTLNFIEPEYNNVEFSSYIVSYNPQNQMDYLIYSARYFLKYCNQQNFTLKQINSKLVPAQNIAITHKTIKDALEGGWISSIPDCTQTSLNKEYCLTQRGEYEYPNE